MRRRNIYQFYSLWFDPTIYCTRGEYAYHYGSLYCSGHPAGNINDVFSDFVCNSLKKKVSNSLANPRQVQPPCILNCSNGDNISKEKKKKKKKSGDLPYSCSSYRDGLNR